jgi:hypothetical protein
MKGNRSQAHTSFGFCAMVTVMRSRFEVTYCNLLEGGLIVALVPALVLVLAPEARRRERKKTVQWMYAL